jgi:hypothetical protein
LTDAVEKVGFPLESRIWSSMEPIWWRQLMHSTSSPCTPSARILPSVIGGQRNSLLRLSLTGYIVGVTPTKLDALILDMLTLCVTAHRRWRLHAIDARAGTGCNAEHCRG